METETAIKKPTISGTSIINHNIRQKLGLTVSEYVMLSFIQELFEDGIGIDEFDPDPGSDLMPLT